VLCPTGRYGTNPTVLGWHEIRQSLYDALPSETVEMGRKIAGYEEEDDSITVCFQVYIHIVVIQ
jgi:hypothetical protein